MHCLLHQLEYMKKKFGRLTGDFIIKVEGKERKVSELMLESGLAIRFARQSAKAKEIRHKELEDKEI